MKNKVNTPLETIVIEGVAPRSLFEKKMHHLMNAAHIYAYTHKVPKEFPMKLFGQPSLKIVGKQLCIHRSSIEILRGPRRLCTLALYLKKLQIEIIGWRSLCDLKNPSQ